MGEGRVTGGDVVVYQEKGGSVRLEVRLEGRLPGSPYADGDLSGRDKSVISRHLRAVFAAGELSRRATVAENATVQREAGREVTRQNRVLRPRRHPLGRLPGQPEAWHRVPHLGHRQAARAPLARLHAQRAAPAREGDGRDGAGREPAREHAQEARARHGRGAGRPGPSSSSMRAHGGSSWSSTSDGWLKRPFTRTSRRRLSRSRAHAGPSRACAESVAASGSAPGLFGQERGYQLSAILGNVEQTFGGKPLYPSVQARAAHLLYFLIKDHPFSDGNKRIGTCCFWSTCDATACCSAQTARSG